jgi:Tfp pilus assembly protein PilN
MIRINLAPVKRKRKKPKPIPVFLAAAVIVLLFAVIVTAYLNLYMKSRIKSLNAQKAENKVKIAQLQDKIKEVQNFETLNAKYSSRKQIIEELKKNQSLPVRILDELSTRLTDGVWLSSLNISKTGLNLSGTGFNNDDVVTFVQSLKASQLFTDVYLQGTNQANQEGINVYTFQLSMKVKA